MGLNHIQRQIQQRLTVTAEALGADVPMWLRDETSQGVEGGSSSPQVVDILYHIFI